MDCGLYATRAEALTAIVTGAWDGGLPDGVDSFGGWEEIVLEVWKRKLGSGRDGDLIATAMWREGGKDKEDEDAENWGWWLAKAEILEEAEEEGGAS